MEGISAMTFGDQRENAKNRCCILGVGIFRDLIVQLCLDPGHRDAIRNSLRVAVALLCGFSFYVARHCEFLSPLRPLTAFKTQHDVIGSQSRLTAFPLEPSEISRRITLRLGCAMWRRNSDIMTHSVTMHVSEPFQIISFLEPWLKASDSQRLKLNMYVQNFYPVFLFSVQLFTLVDSHQAESSSFLKIWRHSLFPVYVNVCIQTTDDLVFPRSALDPQQPLASLPKKVYMNKHYLFLAVC